MNAYDLDDPSGKTLTPAELTRFSEEQRCAHCQTSFTEGRNIGQLLCRLHPGVRLTGSDGHAFYSCCGLQYERHDLPLHARQGCLRVDHMAVPPAYVGGDINARLNDLRAFATVILRCDAFKDQRMAITRPGAECVLYDSSRMRGRAGDDTLTYRFAALAECVESHAMLCHNHHRYTAHPRNLSRLDESATRNSVAYHLPTEARKIAEQQELVATAQHKTMQGYVDPNQRWLEYVDERVIAERRLRGRSKMAPPTFVVIRRIDDKLNTFKHPAQHKPT